jgi:DNA ligase (NAD+)
MRGITINNKNKTEKNKKIKEGECIFPFQYKYKLHTKCLDVEKGKICATEVNPKTQTLTKYGYCVIQKNIKQGKLKNISHKTTLKKKRLKIINPSKLTEMPQTKRLNEEFVKVLTELNDIMLRKGEPFRAKAYREAADAIMLFKEDITDPKQLAEVKGIGKTIMTKLNEFVETGTLQILEKERLNPINQLTKVYGIGPKKAKELISKGITSINDLKTRQELLTDNMKLGVKYFDDIEARIPRSEINEYNTYLSAIFNKVAPPNSLFQIVGSYRRGAETSGDIDIIITNNENNDKAFTDFLDNLIEEKIVIEVLSRGNTKSLTIAKLPIKNARARRVDFLYTPPDEFPFAILYFTGSKIFNTVQRQRALDMGYSLNEHGLYKMNKGVKGEKIKDVKFPDEKSIFTFLNMKYIEPQNRINGNSVITILASQAPEKAQTPIKIKVKKNSTLKNLSVTTIDDLQLFRKEGLSALKIMTEEQLSKLIRRANDAYYCNQSPIMTDNEYDILREYTANKYPNNKVVKEGHTQCNIEIEKNKVKLPYEMWSMDKIKPDTEALPKWMKKYRGPYVLSCKLDGISGLYSTEGKEPKLYTRGNGKTGQDISHLIPFLKLPTRENIVIRGEFIITKERFIEKYAKDFSNPRNFVAGVVNQKKINPNNINKFKDIDFVAYEVIKPELKPSEQMAFLQAQAEQVEVVRYSIHQTITNNILSELLIEWRETYKYEIDGVICINDAIYPRQTGNPEHAFAFKMVISDQIAEAKVLDVIWTPSKDGYLKPRVQIEPISLGGVNIEYATGFNAKFIVDNKIGVGSIIKLIRSGDVIPHIASVIQPAVAPLLPAVPFIWNETGVDIMIENKSEDTTVREKTITAFFKIIGVEGLGPGNIKRIIDTGFNTVTKIISMSKDDFLTVEGFKEKMATKIYEGIKEKIEETTLPELMHATNIFGRGFGTKRFQAILESHPDILVSNEIPSKKLEKLIAINGMAKKSAEKFMKHSSEFVKWAKDANLEKRIIHKERHPPVKNTGHPLFGKKWVMTGFRDRDLINKLNEVGALQTSSVSKNTFVVIIKATDYTHKEEQAIKLGVPVMIVEDFKKKYNM